MKTLLPSFFGRTRPGKGSVSRWSPVGLPSSPVFSLIFAYMPGSFWASRPTAEKRVPTCGESRFSDKNKKISADKQPTAAMGKEGCASGLYTLLEPSVSLFRPFSRHSSYVRVTILVGFEPSRGPLRNASSVGQFFFSAPKIPVWRTCHYLRSVRLAALPRAPFSMLGTLFTPADA